MIGTQLNYTPQDIEIRDLKLQIASKDQVIEDIKHDIENQLFVGRLTNPYEFDEGLKWCLDIINKHWQAELKRKRNSLSRKTLL